VFVEIITCLPVSMLYINEVTTALELTYRPQQLYLSEIILEQLMHNDKALIEEY
jgi:hypothetical protein